MCFIPIWKVDDVTNPHYQETMTLRRLNDDARPLHSRNTVEAAAMIYVNVKVVGAALEAAEAYEPYTLRHSEMINFDRDRVVIICDPMGLRRIDPDVVKRVPVFLNADVRLRNTVMVFQLKDFSCFAQISITHTDRDKLSKDLYEEAKVKVRHNFDVENGWVYKLINLY